MADLELPAWIGNYGPAMGMGLTIVFGMIRGWIIPARWVDRLMKKCDEQVADAQRREAEWRAVADKATSQVDSLLRLVQTTERVVTAALPPAPEGGPHVPEA